MNIAALIYHEVLELELAGILTVFRTAARFTDLEVNAFTVSRTRASVLGASGLVMTPTYAFSAAPEPEVLFVPGGTGVERLMRDKPTRDYLETFGNRVQFLCASTNGALLLGEAGLLKAQIVTTFPSLLETIWKYDPADVAERDLIVNDSGRWFAARSNGACQLALAVVARAVSVEAARRTATHLGIQWSD